MRNAGTRSGARMALLIVVASGLALAWALASVRTAHAELSGPCGATLNGVDAARVNSGDRSDDISVSQHGSVPVNMTSAAGFKSHKIQLEFASRRWTVSEKEDDGSMTFSDTVNVDDYAMYGVGLYKVVGVATLVDGLKCTGAATVDVSGNPLTTVAGGVAAATLGVATVGAAASGAAAASAGSGAVKDMEDMWARLKKHQDEISEAHSREEELRDRMERLRAANPLFYHVGSVLGCFGTLALAALMLPFVAISGGGRSGGTGDSAPPAKGAGAPLRLPRARLALRITLLGLMSGLLAGLGAAVLLQQYSIEYPTLAAIIRDAVAGMAVYGMVVPTLGRTLAVRRVNHRIGALERAWARR